MLQLLLMAAASAGAAHAPLKAIECVGQTEFTIIHYGQDEPSVNHAPRDSIFILNDAARRISLYDSASGELAPLCSTTCKIDYGRDKIRWSWGTHYAAAIDRVNGTWKEIDKNDDSTSMTKTDATCHPVPLPVIRKGASLLKPQF